MDAGLSGSSGRGGRSQGAPPVADLRSQFSKADDAAAADKPSAFGYAAAAASHLDDSPRFQAPPSEGAYPKSRSKYNTRVASIPAVELPDSIHPDRTYLLRLSGPTAVKVTSRDICVALVSEGVMSLEEWDEFVIYYRYESPFERYIHLMEGATFVLRHNSTYSFKAGSIGNSGPDVELRVEDLTIKETTFFLEWVPTTYTPLIVTKMLVSIGLRPSSLRRDNRSADKWIVTTNQDPTEVPHYIEPPRLAQGGRQGKILVTIPRRWTECQHCRSTHHRSHKCPNKGKKRNIPVIDLTSQRAEFPPEFFDQNEKPKENGGWFKPKTRKRYSKEGAKTATSRTTIPVKVSNRFWFPQSSACADLDSTCDTAAEDDDWPSVTSTPRSTVSTRSTLFRQPTPGTFDFKKGQIHAPKVSQHKKGASKTPVTTPSKRGPRKKGASQGEEAKPATPSRPLRPRPRNPTPMTQNEEVLGRKKKGSKPDAIKTPKRTKIDPPTEGVNEERPIISVSELASEIALPDSGPEPSGSGAGVGDAVPSSMPEADAALGAVGGIPHDPPLTCSLFDEGDGDADRGKPPEENSQNKSDIEDMHDGK